MVRTKAIMGGKVILIGNPWAGWGHGRHKILALARMLRSHGFRVEVFLTLSPGDAGRYAQGRLSGADTLVIAGGDGTLNEVINGLKDPARAPLMLLPMGTSNVMAKDLSMPGKLDAFVHILQQRRIVRRNMGKIGSRRFMLSVSTGMEALVTEEVFRGRRWGMSYGRYLLPLARALLRYEPSRVRVTVDGRRLEGEMVLVSTTRRYWGWINIRGQTGSPPEGFDVCLLPKGYLPYLIGRYLTALRTPFSEIRGVTHLTGMEIFIDSYGPAPVQVDGDYFGTTPVLVTLESSVVPMIVPSSYGS